MEPRKEAWEYAEDGRIMSRVNYYNSFHNTILKYETLTENEKEFLKDNSVEDIMHFKAVLPNNDSLPKSENYFQKRIDDYNIAYKTELTESELTDEQRQFFEDHNSGEIMMQYVAFPEHEHLRTDRRPEAYK